ncbi:MAG: AAA family ATPase [Dissulfurispiraceae bacterium]|jgi:hypothetical protein
MEQEITFIVKEEILRNVLKTHSIVLVLGWPGTGKTVTCLRAAKGLWGIYYFNAAAKAPGEELRLHCEGVTMLRDIEELPVALKEGSLLIVDDFDAATAEVASAVKQLLSVQRIRGKMAITAQTRPKLEGGELSIDAVVRLKDETAEILYTSLRDLT